MSDKQFDAVKWGFWLVAFVIAAHVVAALAAEFSCIYFASLIAEGKAECKPADRLMEVLASALAAALAFAGGQRAGEIASKKRRHDDDEEVG